MRIKFLLLVFLCCHTLCNTIDRSHLTSIERSMDVPIKEVDKRIVKYLTVPPPDIKTNVRAVADMNVLFYRYIMDYFYFLDSVGELLIKGDETAYRLLNDIGIEGPEFLNIEMDKNKWDSIGKMYDYHEPEIEELISTCGAIKVMWGNMKQHLKWHLEKKEKTETRTE